MLKSNLEENRHRFGKSLVKFEFDVDVPVVGDTGVTVQHEIEDKNERPFYELGGRDLYTRLSVAYTETAKERLIRHRMFWH